MKTPPEQFGTTGDYPRLIDCRDKFMEHPDYRPFEDLPDPSLPCRGHPFAPIEPEACDIWDKLAFCAMSFCLGAIAGWLFI